MTTNRRTVPALEATTQPDCVAVIDIGSNSLRLVVYDAPRRAARTLLNEKVMCGLGRGLEKTDRLNPEGVTLAKANLQRFIALARALVFGPSLLLMDEPLGALDKSLREQMQLEIKRVQAATGVTILSVTHDQDEALAMSDRIVVMDKGRVEVVGSPQGIYERPASRMVAVDCRGLHRPDQAADH